MGGNVLRAAFGFRSVSGIRHNAFEVLICAFSRVSQHFIFKPRVFTRFGRALPMLGCASRPERVPDNFITKLRRNL